MKFAGEFRAALRIGQASARANLVPMLVLWLLAGMSVGAYYLLEHSSKSVAEIAAACGYGSANALRKVFVAETGKNPLVWRKRAE